MQGVAKMLTAAIMAIILVFSMVSTTALTAFADELAVGIARFQSVSKAKSGTLGLGVNWTLDEAGHLHIYGNGTIESAYTPGLLGTIGGAVGNNGNDIKSISVEDGVAAPADSGYLFFGLKNVTEVDLHNLDVSGVTNMGCMFAHCSSLTDLSSLASWETSNVTVMGTMFSACSSLTDLSPLANWDIAKVYSINHMFEKWDFLTDLSPLANWDTSNVTSISNIFSGCPITKLVLSSKWNKLTDSDLWTPEGGELTGKWVSPDAKMKGPLTTSELIEGWNPTTMAGTWVAEGPDITTSQPTPAQKTSLANATITVKNHIYTGNALKPATDVVLDGKTLKANIDYTVTYSNNVNAGAGKVTVTGVGEYTGIKSATFKIAPASISKTKISGLVSKAYTGNAIKQVPTIKLGSYVLKSGRDFTLSYKSNKKVGKAVVIIKGKGNFLGTKSATFKIVKHKQPMKVSIAKKTSTVKAASLKKKAITLACPLKVTKAKGKVTFTNASTAKAAKTFQVSVKTGKMTIPRAAKKGVYTVKVKVAAAGSGQYAYGSKNVTVKIKIK